MKSVANVRKFKVGDKVVAIFATTVPTSGTITKIQGTYRPYQVTPDKPSHFIPQWFTEEELMFSNSPLMKAMR